MVHFCACVRAAPWRNALVLLACLLTCIVSSPAPQPAQAQVFGEWCTIVRTVTIYAGAQPTLQHSAARCDQVAFLGAQWKVVAKFPDFASAAALRDKLNATNPALVWCVAQRPATIIPGQSSLETTAVRCDGVAGLGAGWNVIARDLSFGAASAMRDKLNAANAPTVWCVIEREVSIAGTISKEFSVARCDQVAGAGPGFRVVQPNMTFTAAQALRAKLAASNLPRVWCVIERQSVLAGQNLRERSVIRCDQVAYAGPGWINVAGPLTFVEASLNRDTFNASNQPAVWCVLRRSSMIGGQAFDEFTVVRCDQAAYAGPGWIHFDGPMTFAAAGGVRDKLNKLPPVWCVARRATLFQGRIIRLATVIACRDLPHFGTFELVDDNLTFPEANTLRDTLNTTEITAALGTPPIFPPFASSPTPAVAPPPVTPPPVTPPATKPFCNLTYVGFFTGTTRTEPMVVSANNPCGREIRSRPDGTEVLGVSISQQPRNGTVTVSGRTVTYRSRPGYTGSDRLVILIRAEIGSKNKRRVSNATLIWEITVK